MKIKNLILYALPLSFAFQACEITNRVPEDTITDLNFWNKVADLEVYTREFYNTLPSPTPSMANYHDYLTDFMVPMSPPSRFFDTATVPTGSDGWSENDWLTIRRINYFMTHYQTVTGEEKEINHYVGEARFFRGQEYFGKVRAFGDIPWYDRDLQTTDIEELMKGRDPRLFVVGKIIEDLEFAAQNMKLPSEVPSGRLHKYCALQLLSRVCLFEATWQKYSGATETTWKPLMEKAASAAKQIMDSGLYDIEAGTAIYNMDADHPMMYKAKFIQEDLTKDRECILPRVFSSATATMSNYARFRSMGISKDFIEQFLAIDGKPIALSDKYRGDATIVNEITDRDPRLWNIVNNRYMPYTVRDGAPVSNFIDLPGAANDTQNTTGYYSSKFNDPDPLQWTANATTTDWYIYRYAETLLNYAEAMYELGQCDQTVLDLTVNKLRARLDYTDGSGKEIKMGRLTTTPEVDPLSMVNGKPRYGYEVAPLLYEIRRERAVELAFENLRWQDICRWKAGVLIENPKTMWGMAVSDAVIAQYTEYNGGNNPFVNSSFAEINDWDGAKKLLRVYDDANEARRKWNDKYYLSPLPLTQTQRNPNLLPQNPGW